MQRALITGITGQDGSYLAELLLSKGYEVHGFIRRASTFNTGRVDHIYKDTHDEGVKLFLHYGDLSDSGQLTNLVYNIQPSEIYHLGAQSHVRVSFEMPEYTGDIVESRQNSIKPLHQRYSEHLLRLRMKSHPFILAVLMPLPVFFNEEL